VRSTRSSWPLRGYLVLIVLLATGMLAGITGYGYLWGARQASETALDEMGDRAGRGAAALSNSVTATAQQVTRLAAQPGIATMPAGPAGGAVQARDCGAALPATPGFREARLDIVGADGRVLCSSERSEVLFGSAVHAGRPWLTRALRTRGVQVAWNETDTVSAARCVVIAQVVLVGGRPAAVVTAFLRTPAISSELARSFAGPSHAAFTVVDSSAGAVVSSSEAPAPALRGEPGGDLARALARARGSFLDEQSARGQWRGVDDSLRLFGSEPVPGGPWRVFAGVRRSDVLADLRGAALRQALVGLLALAGLAGVGSLMHRQVAGPLRGVAEAATRAGRDPQRAQVAERGTREMVALARQFNAMLDVRAGFEAELQHQATHDRLTGLPNRPEFLGRLEHALRRLGPGRGAAVLSVGVNRFNLINDSLGHEPADRLLVEVAIRLTGAHRPGDLLARHSGAQFVLLCEGLAGEDEVREAVERVLASLEEPFRTPSSDVAVTASVGAAYTERYRGPEQLTREASSAMYHARDTGDGWRMFDETLQARATTYLEIERDLRHAVDRGELFLQYQPLLEVSSGRIVGAEALLRWQHPERGLVPPLDFVPVAEQTGQIGAIGEFVLREACRQGARWAAAGHPLRISVNVAVEQFRNDDFPDTVERALADSGVEPGQFCIEITESSLMRSSAERAWDLARLRHLGVHLAIDDFGTGYSSLSYLHEMPVSELKIDRSFISRLDGQARDSHLVEAIIRMARALNLNVVAEGVETGDQLTHLAGLGCPWVQGYLISRPQPADDFISLLEAGRTVIALP
jgi:diguanylate cyclase (GGDEF)-like protein